MISNYIFKLLSTDSTDVEPDSILDSVKARMDDPGITVDDLPDYTFTSLKTLLGEKLNNDIGTSGDPQWAVTRIKDFRRAKKFLDIEDAQELPIVTIQIKPILPDKASGIYRYKATVLITVQTDPSFDNSNKASFISQRIKSLFTDYSQQSGIPTQIDIAKNVTGLKGLLNLTINWVGLLEDAWDVQTNVYQAYASVIQ